MNPCAAAAEAHSGAASHTTEPLSATIEAGTLRTYVSQQEKSLQSRKVTTRTLQTREARKPQLESRARSPQLEKVHQQQRLSAAKNKYINNK